MPLESLLALGGLWVEEYNNRHALIAKTVIKTRRPEPGAVQDPVPLMRRRCCVIGYEHVT